MISKTEDKLHLYGIPTGRISSLVDLLRYRAAQQPTQEAYSFLVDGEDEVIAATYDDLDRRARAIASYLQACGFSGERALLLYQPGSEYIEAFFGCLYAGVIAIPCYPPRLVKNDRSVLKLRAIIENARPGLALTTGKFLAKVETLVEQAPEAKKIQWFSTDEINDMEAKGWHNPTLTDTSLAFLQYTSGSTASPKGVMLSHGNLLYNSQLIQQSFEHQPNSRGVVWLPPYHDMGLIGGIIQPVYAGSPVTLMSPMVFLQRPFRWLKAISRYGATNSGGPNFAYELCIQRVSEEQKKQLDLSSWTLAFTGAEPINYKTLDRFAEAFSGCGFRKEAFFPCYGLAEATLIVSGSAKASLPVIKTVNKSDMERHQVTTASYTCAEDSKTLVGCGKTVGEQKIVIVNPESMTECYPGEIGEIWISGPSVAQGYWQQPELSTSTFHASLKDSGEGPFLRSGDMGFLENGELFVTGRLKDLIIIKGRNFYPQDIERSIEHCHPAIRVGAGAAFAVEVNGEERLIITQEIEREHRKTNPTELITAIRRVVSQEYEQSIHEIVLLKPGSIPKTSSGKIQRYLCKKYYLSGTLEKIA